MAPPLVDVATALEAPDSRAPTGTGGRVYVGVATKFAIAQLVAAAWLLISIRLSMPWVRDLADSVGRVPAAVVVSLIAYLPGWLVAFLATSLVLDRQPPLRHPDPDDDVTVIIAARNEAERIAETLGYLARQEYRGRLQVLVMDNGSTDGTGAVAEAAGVALGLDVRCLVETTPGKSHALNTGLAATTTALVITLDADTLLHPHAVRNVVARLRSSPDDVRAVAGSVLVRNSRRNLWTRMQEWDYFLGIASVKRMQGLYQGTLVAQGAFSLYDTEAVRRAGGWPDAIGEDIVLTWHILREGSRVYYEPTAVAFTDAPERLRHFARQRSRWARGMIEGLRTVQPWQQPRPITRVLTATNLLIPLLDMAYTLVWMPGLVLAFTGRFWVVGPYTLAVLPLTMIVNGLLLRFQKREVFDRLGLRVRRNIGGFLGFVGLYQLLMSPVAVLGYAQELLGRERRWK